jgi:ubiquinone biosynthesis monooxygenase Coq7
VPESAAAPAEPVSDSADGMASATQPADVPNLPYVAAASGSSIVVEGSGTAWPAFASLPRWLQQELRSDHAGEFGAVMIYHGVLAVSRDESARQFAERHLVTEQKHLELMEEIIPHNHRTRLLPIWRMMGWLTGAIPALFGRQAVFATIEAVETFVDHHYQQQIVRLDPDGEFGLLRQTLVGCQADEVSHRDEAARLALPKRGAFMRLWCAIVGYGSAAAVVAAKRV